jgi:hypothetical protein
MDKEPQKKPENPDLDPEGGDSPYSPSKALEEEERMDWSANLTGTKELFERPPQLYRRRERQRARHPVRGKPLPEQMPSQTIPSSSRQRDRVI